VQHPIFDPRGTANRVEVEPFAEGIVEVEAQLTQQGVEAEQTQQLARMAGAQIGYFTFAQPGLKDAVQRGFVRLPRLVTPVQIVVEIKRRPANRSSDTEIIRCRIQLVAFELPFQ